MNKTSICLTCSSTFVIGPGCTGKYCGTECSKIGIGKLVKSKAKINLANKMLNYEFNPKYCKYCSLPILYKYRNKNQFCSQSCSRYHRHIINGTIITDEKKLYWNNCEFKFSPYSFPQIPGYQLLLKIGLYNNQNLNGVARDHMISKSYGWKNSIDSEIISHPANCNLIKQPINLRKGSKCSITINELLIRIKNWY